MLPCRGRSGGSRWSMVDHRRVCTPVKASHHPSSWCRFVGSGLLVHRVEVWRRAQRDPVFAYGRCTRRRTQAFSLRCSENSSDVTHSLGCLSSNHLHCDCSCFYSSWRTCGPLVKVCGCSVEEMLTSWSLASSTASIVVSICWFVVPAPVHFTKCSSQRAKVHYFTVNKSIWTDCADRSIRSPVRSSSVNRHRGTRSVVMYAPETLIAHTAVTSCYLHSSSLTLAFYNLAWFLNRRQTTFIHIPYFWRINNSVYSSGFSRMSVTISCLMPM